MEAVAVSTAECSGVGGVKLTLVDEYGPIAGGSPQFVCNGVQGAQGVPGATGPAGPSAAFATVTPSAFLQLPGVTTGVSVREVAHIIVNLPSAGSLFAVATGYCQFFSTGTAAVQITDVANSIDFTLFANTPRVSGLAGTPTNPAFVPVSTSRLFPSVAAGPKTIYLNGGMIAGGASNTNLCPMTLTVFFSSSMLPQP